jgi:hypothetical protein
LIYPVVPRVPRVQKVFVTAQGSIDRDIVRGTLVRYNKKSVTIVTDDGQR